MRYFILLILLGWSGHALSGQNKQALPSVKVSKPVIDSQAIADWQEVADPAISSDGQYFMYRINNEPRGSSTLVIKPIHGEGKEWRYPGAGPSFFSADGLQAIIPYQDSLLFLFLATGAIMQLTGVQSTQGQRGGRWLTYRRKIANKELVLKDLVSGRERRYDSVTTAAFSPDSNFLLLKTSQQEGGKSMEALEWVTLGSDEAPRRIWPAPGSTTTMRLGRWQFDKSGRQLTFSIEDRASDRKEKSIWYYAEGMTSSEFRAGPRTLGKNTTINSDASFSADGRWLLFEQLSRTPLPEGVGPVSSKVTVWSYKDLVLQPEQARRMLSQGMMNADMQPGVSLAMVASVGGVTLRPAHDSVFFSASTPSPNGHFMVVGVGVKEWQSWLPVSSVYLEDLRDSSMHLLQKGGWNNLGSFSYSPGGRWLLYYDMREGAYYSYELNTGRIHNITHDVPTVFRSEYGNGVGKGPVASVAGWLAGDAGVLLYDNYDLWQIDPSGRLRAMNITNGYGYAHKIRLRLLNGPESRRNRQEIFRPGEELLLTGFSARNKYNGFYSKQLKSGGDPKELSMAPYTFFRVESQRASSYYFDNGMEPLKAEKARIWIVKRQSASEAPNYYWTEDLIHFTALTHIAPQQGYNWLRSELVTWKQLDGTESQGVLYKPEDFDSTKKYPLLFNCYEQLSHRLYEFPRPETTGNDINIPWFVSRGYLVFTPDIHYQVGAVSGKPVGAWAYNSVVSAAQHLARLPYVDGKRMGIQGHSFGGLETAYLITHTGVFAAAAEAAGSTDPISAYLTLTPIFAPIEHGDKQWGIEMGHELYGASPWERPDLYRENSAVLHADRVTTPLLIMHNEHDNSIPWRQGIELYMALRRLHRPCWMLQYERGAHSLHDEDAVDYTLRLTQFFDYYLKGALPPKWMTKGVPAIIKNIDSGLELDNSGDTP